MKTRDWNGHRIPLIAHAYNIARGVGVDLHIRAASLDEAFEKVAQKLQHHQDFLRKTEGHYKVDFAKVI
ncbi:MAG: hypothetical protein IT558_00810 [Alphaproteobacteria bacterium]|nr:hypothetical protein [Alphaproteobacteria bacterium]